MQEFARQGVQVSWRNIAISPVTGVLGVKLPGHNSEEKARNQATSTAPQ
jgi:hypothetical protein